MGITEKVKELIIFETGCNPDVVTPTATLTQDVGVDSLDIVEIIMALEEEFDIDITDEDASAWKTVGDVVEYILNGQF